MFGLTPADLLDVHATCRPVRQMLDEYTAELLVSCLGKFRLDEKAIQSVLEAEVNVDERLRTVPFP